MIKNLTLEDIYVFTLVKTESGLYRPMTEAEISAIEIKSTGDQVLDAMARMLAQDHVYRSYYVSRKLGLKTSQVNEMSKIFFGMPLRDLLSSYRRRRLFDLVRYTNLEPAEVAKLCDFRSVKSMYVHFSNIEKETFFSYRNRHQKKETEITEKYRID